MSKNKGSRSASADKRVSREDIENKVRQIQSEVDTTADAAKPAGIAIGGAVAAAAIVVAYALGQRKNTKKTTIVEIRRV